MATRRDWCCDRWHGYLPDFDQPVSIIFKFGVYSILASDVVLVHLIWKTADMKRISGFLLRVCSLAAH